MNNKDWIILCTPIVVNGILLFIFQTIIKRFFYKKEENKKLKNIRIIYVLDILDNLHRSIYRLTHGITSNDFTEVINEANKYFQDFRRHIDSNDILDGKYDVCIRIIFTSCESLCKKLKDVQSQENNIITDCDRTQCEELLSKMYSEISNLMKQCRNELYI